MPRLLLVDDDVELLEVMAKLLTKEGFEVDRALSGQEALARLLKAQPDLIVLDLLMPVMDGWQFVWELRKAGPLTIPIVAISGDADTARKAEALGALGYLTKPFSPEALLAEVKRRVPRCA